MQKYENFLSKHFRNLISFLFIISTLLIALYIKFLNQETETLSNIERFVISTQIVSFIFVITATVIAVWQFCLSCKSEISKNEIEKVQKAIDLAEYYKDNILSNYLIIKTVYENSDITK